MTETAPLADHLAQRLRSQVDTWRSDLLTLDRRQKLVYFKHTKSSSFEIVADAVGAELFRALSTTVEVVPPDVDSGRRRVRVQDKTEAEVRAVCRRLDLTSQQVYADRGFWTLYVGIGMLKWVDPADGKSVSAPLLLCPVELKRTGAHSPYLLARNDEEVVLNPALRLLLEKSFSLSLDEVDGEDPDLSTLFADLRAKIVGREGWEVEQDRAVVTTFTFHKEAIYRDLEEHSASVLAHPLVQVVALGADAPTAGSQSFPTPGAASGIDDETPPEELVSILDADSSQRACIIAAREGRSFVMDGPPGTGKSQTIANIIAELIAADKRVLFVSEKAAALDVVRDRLRAKGLSDFVLELHSHSATRKEVVKQLHESLSQRITARGQFADSDRRALVAARRELSAYAQAMNEVRHPLGRSVHDVAGRLVTLQNFSLPALAGERWGSLSAAELDRLLEIAGDLSRAWRPVSEGADYLWRDLVGTPHSRAATDHAEATTAALARAAEDLVVRVGAVDDNLHLTWPVDISASHRRVQLLELLERRPAVPMSWLTAPSAAPIRQRATTLESHVFSHGTASQLLGDKLGAARLELVDPDACAAVDRSPDLGELTWTWDASRTSTEVDEVQRFLEESALHLAPILESARILGGMLGIDTTRISMDRAADLGQLAALGGTGARPERSWLNPAVQAALDESLRVLGSLVGLVVERRTAMERVFQPSALEHDLQALDVRFKETHRGFGAFSSQARADKKLLKSITVNGKADKTVRARLEEAATWQRAESSLADAERHHADRLGAYYERTNTDFGRLQDAVAAARRAIELAGNDLNGGPMADQLSRDGSPDPRLTVVADQLIHGIRSWSQTGRHTLSDQSMHHLMSIPVDVAADVTQRAASALLPHRDALAHVADAAGTVIDVGLARQVRAAAVERNRTAVAIYDGYDDDRRMLGDVYDGLATDWGMLRAHLGWLDEVREVVGEPATQAQARQLLDPLVLSEELRQTLGLYAKIRDEWTALFKPEVGETLADDLDIDLREAVELLGEMSASAVRDIEEWDVFATKQVELAEVGLGPVVDSLVSGRGAADAVVPTVERSILQAWIEATIGSDPRLSYSRASDRDARVGKFRGLDKQQVDQAYATVAARCSARRPRSMDGSAATLIRREALKKTRHLPIRELLARTREVVQELKPCFMMSPLSVSQFLPGDVTFDAVVFDEASQVLPSDAVNCIYRGAQLIVAGDEKQLPPTSFFAQSTDEDDVDEELDIFESVLKSCKSSLPSLPLTWHYRSKHESLIAFSNYQFYAPDSQKLQTFPSATFTSPDLGVGSYVVNGTYQRGGARDNPVEAGAVVDRVLFHRQNHPELSIGVVTFSAAQEAAVTLALEARAVSEPDLQGLLDDHDRLSGFFVKNLENVQGDERDLIIFSLGYGPDTTGKLTMNFGPVGRQGGWRRLNVAITRARRRVEVVSSFRASDMREGSNESLAHLRAYLDYAERGMAALEVQVSGPDGRTETDMLGDIADVISGWGYVTESQVGTADYRLDLAVQHPDRPGEYLLAIEGDGESYASAGSGRDRDRLRDAVLAGLGWRIHRVWSVPWYRDRPTEVERLRVALDAARAGTGVPVPAAVEHVVELDVEEIDFDAPPAWAVPYRVGMGPVSRHHDLGDVAARPALQRYLGAVLATEAPVHRDLLFKRIRDDFGYGRIGSVIKGNVEFVLDHLTVDEQRVTTDTAGFVRLGALADVRSPINEDTIRKVGQIPPEELDLAVLKLVRDAVTLEDETLVLAVRRVFRWRRAGSDIQAAAQRSVERLLRAGQVSRTVSGGLQTGPAM